MKKKKQKCYHQKELVVELLVLNLAVGVTKLPRKAYCNECGQNFTPESVGFALGFCQIGTGHA